MTRHHPEPARLPPSDLPGLDPSWSRLVATTDERGVRHEWHVLDSAASAVRNGLGTATGPAAAQVGTLLCVHGNPTWSYLWRRLVASPPPGWRVVAPDALGMGFSERSACPRRLEQRIDDLAALTHELGLAGPVVTVAHDWGGPISLGWALRHLDQLRGVVLANTAVDQPVDAAPPWVIRVARSDAVRDTLCVRTPAFVRAATALSGPDLPRAVRAAFASPYVTARRRAAVGDFVEDIPLEADHPSGPALHFIRDGLERLAQTPVLLLWGPLDPVFSDRYLRDLMRRLPHADVHRYEGAAHLVTEDAPTAADAITRWVIDRVGPAAGEHAGSATPPPATGGIHLGEGAAPVLGALTARADHSAAAIVQLGRNRRHVSFAHLNRRVLDLAAGLAAAGVRPGQRVALLVPPGPDLAATLYACWRIGAIVVIADAGLGVRSLGRALRGAGPDYVVGISQGLAAAAALRVPGRRIAAGPVSLAERRTLGIAYTLDDLARLGSSSSSSHDQEAQSGRRGAADAPISPLDHAGWAIGPPVGPPGPTFAELHDDAECAVLFTSGATGPSKGVVYRNRQVRAQLDALRRTYAITVDDRLVAAFAPFALYGPLLGITSAVPAVDVTAPAELTASALAEAVAAIEATLVFASPAALRNVVETAATLTTSDRSALAGVRLVMSAGAPVPVGLLRSVRELFPAASLRTPYGMTEVLPVADISLEEIEAVGAGNGVCVGHPVAGVEVAVSPLTAGGEAAQPPTAARGVTGEVCVRAEHVKARYDRLWSTERDSARDPGWHRTSDVGHLDGEGRLWVEGRLAHIIVSADGVVTPVGVEQRVEQLAGVRSAAVVGVGPRGTQQVVVVVVPAATSPSRGRVADEALSQGVRSVAGVPVAAVLTTGALPVDIRHQSKIDRARVAAWSERVLSGRRSSATP